MFSVQLLLPPPLLLQQAYADDYTVSDEASCLALPGGSPSWVNSSNTCEIHDDTLIIGAGDTLTISSGTTSLITSSGVIDNNDGTINNFGTIDNNVGGTIINKCGGFIDNSGGTITGNPVQNESCNLVERPKVPQPKDLIP
jgi:hypothetical protein